MDIKSGVKGKWAEWTHKEKTSGITEKDTVRNEKSTLAKIEHFIDIVGKVLYHSRKIVLSIPVCYYAVKLAIYNSQHLPEQVGLFLQSNGEYLHFIGRSLAVTGPLAITAGCLAMMFLARKAMYSWAISIFSLVLPILLLVSNIYPA